MEPLTTNESSIGYASYQQQYLGHGEFVPNDLASIVLFFSIIGLLVVSFVFYFWFTEWHKVPAQQRHEEALERQKEVDQLVENLQEQVKAVFKIPVAALIRIVCRGTFFSSTYPPLTPTVHFRQNASLTTYLSPPPTTAVVSREQYNVWAHRVHHAFSLLFLLGFAVGLITLLVGASGPVTHATSATLQAALFLLVLCTNLFLITRQRYYYRHRKQLFGEDDAHLNAVYKTHFDSWDNTLANWIQLAILIIEFFQLLTFPLRDLITVNSFSTSDDTPSSFSHFLSILLNAGGLMPDMRTPVWYTYTLWTALVMTLFSLIVAVLVHGLNVWRPYKIPNSWVRWCIPVATLLYIPVLTTFVSSAACQSLNVPTNVYASTLRCHAPNISQQSYLWMSLIGYIVAYFLMTMFLTSYERIPVHNEIAFKSISVAFIKNMGLLLAIVFLLVESTTNKNRMRAILSIIILLTMICYNIKTKPCYVDKINFFRVASYSCILWTSVLVAILSDTNAAQNLGPLSVLCVIVSGWILIIVLFIILYCVYYRMSRPVSLLETKTTPSVPSGPPSITV
ncbi:hypothetical protein DM01DRAFT_1408287 [Hesseltinella vesiculosa]|uniref:Uncharacterized protein n=1 Tax=Hesseltinella vesiculosa TaxID=101127 RepID=A0A1X2GF87_9FUNG|nr:hypothetical protein DM01DRAFT_1408287 [Hesseltinella vesiculosa]